MKVSFLPRRKFLRLFKCWIKKESCCWSCRRHSRQTNKTFQILKIFLAMTWHNDHLTDLTQPFSSLRPPLSLEHCLHQFEWNIFLHIKVKSCANESFLELETSPEKTEAHWALYWPPKEMQPRHKISTYHLLLIVPEQSETLDSCILSNWMWKNRHQSAIYSYQSGVQLSYQCMNTLPRRQWIKSWNFGETTS